LLSASSPLGSGCGVAAGVDVCAFAVIVAAARYTAAQMKGLFLTREDAY
jgi:hypothetical protein